MLDNMQDCVALQFYLFIFFNWSLLGFFLFHLNIVYLYIIFILFDSSIYKIGIYLVVINRLDKTICTASAELTLSLVDYQCQTSTICLHCIFLNLDKIINKTSMSNHFVIGSKLRIIFHYEFELLFIWFSKIHYFNRSVWFRVARDNFANWIENERVATVATL